MPNLEPIFAKVAADYGLDKHRWSLVAYDWGIGNVTRLIQAGKGWSDIPTLRQDYAINILLGGETRAIAAAEPLPA